MSFKYSVVLICLSAIMVFCIVFFFVKPAVFQEELNMDETAASALAEFARYVREATDKVNAAKGGNAEKLQTELSLYISRQMPLLLQQGVQVMEIQEALRAATDIVPQTYAPDADPSDDEAGESLPPPVSETAYFLPMEESVIADFAAGKLNADNLMERLCNLEDITALEMTDGLDYVLTDFGKNPRMEGFSGGGEVVAGSDGEAFAPEYLEVRSQDGSQFVVCDPMVLKSAEEVRSLHGLAEAVTEKEFFKKADIKKLIKSGWLNGYDARSVRREADYIKRELWNEFVRLREVYRKAAERRQGVVIFTGYEGAGLED